MAKPKTPTKSTTRKPMQTAKAARPAGTHALFVNAPTALVEALDARVEELRQANAFGRKLTRSDLVIEVLGEAAKGWAKVDPT